VSPLKFRRTYRLAGSVLLSALASGIIIIAQQPPRRFGGAYSELDERRQHFIHDWVARFIKVTGQSLDARSFYDDILSLSTKTTFDAVTHALMTTPLTDASGQKFGDGLTIIERVDTRQRRSPRNVKRSSVPNVRAINTERAGDAGALARVQAASR
jgi:hypothetical protein